MKLTNEGIAVIEGDTHISQWVIDSKRLDIAAGALEPLRQYVPVGGVVLDLGACIGDHTATYAQWVGDEGSVLAFEPNPAVYECLVYNTKSMVPVIAINLGVSDESGRATLIESPNVGASHLELSEVGLELIDIDYYDLDIVDFIKIDVEGFEVKALTGALDTIQRCNPVMLIEVNRGALERAGTSVAELFRLLTVDLGYSISMMDTRLSYDDPLYDILCLPQK